MVQVPVGDRGTEICFDSFNLDNKVFRRTAPSPILIIAGTGAVESFRPLDIGATVPTWETLTLMVYYVCVI